MNGIPDYKLWKNVQKKKKTLVLSVNNIFVSRYIISVIITPIFTTRWWNRNVASGTVATPKEGTFG